MINVRENLLKQLDLRGHSMEWLSRRIKRNPAYIQQFIERGVPKELHFKDILVISEVLDMPLEKFGITNLQRKNGTEQTSLAPSGFSEDAEPYSPPAGSILTLSDTIAYYRMTSNALEAHPLRIVPGDVLAFDISPAAIEALKSEQVVIVQCYDPDPQVMKARTIVRAFMRPALVTTNRERMNEAFSLDDPTLPFEPHIKGVMRSVVRLG